MLGSLISSQPSHQRGICNLICSRAGGRIALGSDFPVESIDPLKGLYAAVTRLAGDGSSPVGAGGWRPEEKLSREQALRGFTIDGLPLPYAESQRFLLMIFRRLCFVLQLHGFFEARQEI